MVVAIIILKCFLLGAFDGATAASPPMSLLLLVMLLCFALLCFILFYEV